MTFLLRQSLVSGISHLDLKDVTSVKNDLHLLFELIENCDSLQPQTRLMSDITNSSVNFLTKTYKTQSPNTESLLGAMSEIAEFIDNTNNQHRPAFHNRIHFAFVQLSGRVIDTYNCQFKTSFGHETLLPALSDHDLVRNALIDTIHDLGHTGGGNTHNGVYTPLLMENRSLDLAQSFFDKAGIDKKDQDIIRFSVQASDPNLPHEILHHAYDAHFNRHCSSSVSFKQWDKKFQIFDKKTRSDLSELTRALYEDPVISFSAARLADADIFASFGLHVDRTNTETIKLDQEMQHAKGPALCDAEGKPLAAARLFALYKIMGTRLVQSQQEIKAMFRTPGAQWLGGDVAFQLQSQAEAQLGEPAVISLRQKIGLQPTG